MYTVDTHKAGIVSMYENQLIVMFRTFENGIFVFSMADQGDLLIAQIVYGRIHVVFDFGTFFFFFCNAAVSERGYFIQDVTDCCLVLSLSGNHKFQRIFLSIQLRVGANIRNPK